MGDDEKREKALRWAFFVFYIYVFTIPSAAVCIESTVQRHDEPSSPPTIGASLSEYRDIAPRRFSYVAILSQNQAASLY
jgi:hypothetical protein